MIKLNPDFVINVGDMTNHGTTNEWAIFENITRELRDNMSYYPCLGNHEYKNRNYFSVFPFFSRYYSFTYQDFKFTILDTNKLDEFQLEWLESELNCTNNIIVIGHHPVFMLRNRTMPENIELLHPLFVKYNISLYLSGHEHYFYHTTRDNVSYVISGGGGAPLHSPDSSLAEEGDKWFKDYHFVHFTIKDNLITIKTIRV